MTIDKKIYLYNTASGKKEVFEPLQKGKVGMYCCGVTVYDLCHIGHARSSIAFDMIRKYLMHCGYKVKFVKNFTDVDDKIIARANEVGEKWDAIASRFIDEYRVDMGKLGIDAADIEPKATDHIDDILEIVSSLVNSGDAYEVKGDVFFRVRNFSTYGKFSNKKLDDLRTGVRIAANESKEDPLDFALWKSAKEGEPGWQSPWGKGRPGWHIECSAMSIKHLGSTFDIHAGGKDLVFPHHENEIAQSEAYTGKVFSKYWLHNGFVTLNEEKMSKSLGNFFTIREIFNTFSSKVEGSKEVKEKVASESIRYLLLSTHYRNPIDFSLEGLLNSRIALNGFYDLFKRLNEKLETLSAITGQESEKKSIVDFNLFYADIDRAMCDDFNTAKLLGVLNRIRSEVNRQFEKINSVDIAEFFKLIADCSTYLGVFKMPADNWSFADASESAVSDVDAWKELPGFAPDDMKEKWIIATIEGKELLLVELRNVSRNNKDFQVADGIREYMKERGRILEDRPDGTTRVKR